LLLGRSGGGLGFGEEILDLAVIVFEHLDDIGHGASFVRV
jgi:hypothetical protein